MKYIKIFKMNVGIDKYVKPISDPPTKTTTIVPRYPTIQFVVLRHGKQKITSLSIFDPRDEIPWVYIHYNI